jgi:NADH-quinone oxidoreductase subunit D
MTESDMSKSTTWEMPSERLTLNFGPQHPATHGTLRVEMELDGEVVTRATPEIGYLHTGFEKLAEHMNYNQFICVTDRMNYLSPICNNLAFALSAEKLMDLEPPKRGQYERVIMAELTRISDHQVAIGMQALDIGAFTAFLYLFQEREKLYDIFEMVTGSRLTTTYTRIGGVMRAMPDYCIAKIREFCAYFPRVLDECETLLNRNQIWLGRTVGVSAMSAEDSISYGLTGPCLRAAGVEWDIRKAEPYSSYEDFDFDIPIGKEGDVYDRYLVRMEEMRQSLRIIDQALNNLPDGPVNVDDAKVILPDKDDVYNTMEGLIHHFMITMQNHGADIPEGEVYVPTEAPNGELGFFIVSTGGREPYRVHARPPSLYNYQIFQPTLEGRMLSDAVAIMGSLNVIAGELDR